VVRDALGPGAVLTAGDLVVKKPGTGIPAALLDSVIGRRLRRGVPADHLLMEDDLEPGV
jgi:N-acetylneuraminate synthase